LICRAMGDVSDKIGRPTDNGQVCIVNTTIDGDITTFYIVLADCKWLDG
jgi:hypothetical protein